jgi:ElaB/YqjD/DUF883 family membrane-anchored ribosome-binding protein
MNTVTPQTAENSTRSLTANVADSASSAIGATKHVADKALDSAQNGVDSLREKIPAMVGSTVSELERLTRAAVEYAHSAYSTASERLDAAGECTVSYVRQKPVKAVIIAAAGGAALAGVLTWLARSRHA